MVAKRPNSTRHEIQTLLSHSITENVDKNYFSVMGIILKKQNKRKFSTRMS